MVHTRVPLEQDQKPAGWAGCRRGEPLAKCVTAEVAIGKVGFSSNTGRFHQPENADHELPEEGATACSSVSAESYFGEELLGAQVSTLNSGFRQPALVTNDGSPYAVRRTQSK